MRNRSEWEMNTAVDDSRRILFPGSGAVVTENNSLAVSTALNFSNVIMNAGSTQAKPEFREESAGGSLDLTLETEDSEQSSLGRKRRAEMASYLVQSSAGSIPTSHPSIPATFWAMGNGGDPVWAINNSNFYRGAAMAAGGGGIQFMNFASRVMPVNVMGHQLGLSNNAGISESNLGMLAALNSAYRPFAVPETASHRHHPRHGGDGHETTASTTTTASQH